MDLVDHAGADDDGARVHGGREPVQLVLQQREALGHPDQQHVDPLRRRVPGRQQPHRVRVDAVARQIRPGRLLAEEGVGDLRRPVRGQRRGQGAPPVADDHDHVPDRSVGPLVVREMPQQVLVGGVPGAELVARVLGEAGEVELAP